MEFKVINPATEEIEKTYQGPTLEESLKEIEISAKVQLDWKQTDFSNRATLMKKAAGVLRKRKKEFAELMTREMGKPITQAEGEVEKCAWVCDFYADNAQKFLAPKEIKTDAKKSYVRFDPIGVVFAIMPWNFPFWQVFRFAAPALMAGNAGILKHASNVPGSALGIEEVFFEAGFPKNLFKTLLVDSKIASELIDSKNIAAVTVTGSTGAGSSIASRAGKNIKKCVLELGGSDPFIVLDDVNVKTCATQAVQGRIINAGQSCISAKRFIVLEKIKKEFEQEFVEHIKSLKIGDPMDPQTQVGPLAREDLVQSLDDQLARSVKMGAKILTGGKKIEGKGYFFEPTVLGNTTTKMPVFLEETFGPLTAVISAKDEMEAVKLANATQFGLGASIWSKDLDRAEKLVPLIDAGTVFVNKIVASDPRLPFGGIKMSGFGRELGSFGIKEFVNIKSVVIQ